ncbi:MAG: hypothetical protein ABL921_03390 [Pirellula sp.]
MRTNITNWFLGCLVAFSVQHAIAAGADKIIRVEEDWELVVETPDPLQDAPQVSTWMSPRNSLTGEYFGVDLNHAQRSGYEGGGFQTKAMNGSTLVEDRLSHSGQNLTVQNETVKWTQVMAIDNQDLVFSIKNGTSTSWGSFGGTDTAIRVSSGLSNLNSYNPETSCESSGVGYASNRVASLKLAKIRFYTENGQEFVITLDRTIQ